MQDGGGQTEEAVVAVCVFFLIFFFFLLPLFSEDYRRMMTAAQHNNRRKKKKESLRLYRNRLTHCVQQRRQNNAHVLHSLVTHSTNVISIGRHIQLQHQLCYILFTLSAEEVDLLQ